MKKILTIQDISCVGKCSLTVALPIISAMGVETAILPTAVLSTHTMFQNFVCQDLTETIKPFSEHWKAEKIHFDAIYTGYLGSFEQIDLMKTLFDDFKSDDNFVFVDPAMADNGSLYPAFDEEFARHMASLCAKADIIVPNITEACFMTGTKYETQYDEAYVKTLLKKLSENGTPICILTGVGFSDDTTGVMGYDRNKDEYFYYCHEKLPVSFHGTGDIFSSTCVGAVVRGYSWQEAVQIAADYTAQCIRLTLADPAKPWYGVNFEEAIPDLVKWLEK